MRLNVKAFAIACGTIWGAGVFVLTWWVILFEGPSTEGSFLGQIYRGYTFSPLGSVIGFAWALADGVAGGALFAWLYNRIAGGAAGSRGVES
jgi:hypothetical protein